MADNRDQSPLARWARNGNKVASSRQDLLSSTPSKTSDPKSPKNLNLAKALGKCAVCDKPLNGAEKQTGLCGKHA